MKLEHCQREFKPIDIWYLESNKDFYGRYLKIGRCLNPKCKKTVAELVEIRKTDDKVFRQFETEKKAEKLIALNKNSVVCTSQELKLKACKTIMPRSIRYGENKIVRVIRGRRPKIVVIGGGTGLPVILNALKEQNADITAIVTVADDGGSSGAIRDYINVVPPGDIRNVLVSLSDLPQEEKDIFQYRFNSSDSFFAGHAIGNLIIAALDEMQGNIFDAVQSLSRMMRIDGRIFPASNEPLTLNAEFIDGTTESGETEITSKDKRIKRVWVTDTDSDDEPKAVLPVLAAIMQADAVVLGPGSLFTSILPNLMISNLGEAVRETSAEVIYICNISLQYSCFSICIWRYKFWIFRIS